MPPRYTCSRQREVDARAVARSGAQTSSKTGTTGKARTRRVRSSIDGKQNSLRQLTPVLKGSTGATADQVRRNCGRTAALVENSFGVPDLPAWSILATGTECTTL